MINVEHADRGAMVAASPSTHSAVMRSKSQTRKLRVADLTVILVLPVFLLDHKVRVGKCLVEVHLLLLSRAWCKLRGVLDHLSHGLLEFVLHIGLKLRIGFGILLFNGLHSYDHRLVPIDKVDILLLLAES